MSDNNITTKVVRFDGDVAVVEEVATYTLSKTSFEERLEDVSERIETIEGEINARKEVLGALTEEKRTLERDYEAFLALIADVEEEATPVQEQEPEPEPQTPAPTVTKRRW